MDSRYERLKVIALDELRQGDFLSPQLLIKVILEIRQEVKDYSAAYHVAFSRLVLWIKRHSVEIHRKSQM